MVIEIIDYNQELHKTVEGTPSHIEQFLRENYPSVCEIIPQGDLHACLRRVSALYGVGIKVMDGEQVAPKPNLYPIHGYEPMDDPWVREADILPDVSPDPKNKPAPENYAPPPKKP